MSSLFFPLEEYSRDGYSRCTGSTGAPGMIVLAGLFLVSMNDTNECGVHRTPLHCPSSFSMLTSSVKDHSSVLEP